VPASVPASGKKKRRGLDLDALARLVPSEEERRLGPKQRALLDALANAGGALRVSDLLRVSERDGPTLMKLVGRRLSAHGASRESGAANAPALEPEPPPPTLTAEQEQALAPIIDDVDARRFSTTLLLGITGSGKTEVYLRAIARALERGRGAIVLVPEIALTPQTERRFRARFGALVAVLHSRQGGRVRRDAWLRARSREARVGVAPRSPVP